MLLLLDEKKMEEFEQLEIKRDQIWASILLIWIIGIALTLLMFWFIVNSNMNFLFVSIIFLLVIVLYLMNRLRKEYKNIIIKIGTLKIESMKRIEEIKVEVE